jgi:peptidyl-prolyl cis-trans isomerase C
MTRALLAGWLLLVGCDRLPSKATVDFRRAQPPGTAGGPWVARFGGDTLTVAEASRRFAEMSPTARARFQALEPRRDYVEGVVRFELLAREAVRQGLANQPEVIEAARRVMVQLLLKRVMEEKPESVGVPEVSAFYQAHLTDYVKPKMTRLSHIRFAREDRAKAETVLGEARALKPLDLAGFGRLARLHSQDERTRALDGDLRFQSDEELGHLYGPELVPAAAALEQVGEVAPALVETATALHVLKLQGRQPPLELTLEQARPSIVQRLLFEAKQERLKALLGRLKEASDFELDEKALASIVVDPKAPAVEPASPAPGYQPAPATRLGGSP